MTAIISSDGLYRYALHRDVPVALGVESKGRVVFVMLNPSTADATNDDPTIRRCVGFAAAWGFDKLTVVNLYAYRATSPAAMKVVRERIGPENDSYLYAETGDAAKVVAAWGTHAEPERVEQVRDIVTVPLWCLGKTKDNHPRHPLYVAKTARVERWP